jgi:hypothetical protein
LPSYPHILVLNLSARIPTGYGPWDPKLGNKLLICTINNYGDNKGSQPHNSPTASLFETPIRSQKVYTSYSKSGQQNCQNIDNIFMDDIKPTVNLIRTKEYSNVSKIANRDHLTDENWHKWKDCMKRVFNNCDIMGYIMGMVKRPNEDDDMAGAHNWDKNNSWAQQVIIHNVTSF